MLEDWDFILTKIRRKILISQTDSLHNLNYRNEFKKPQLKLELAPNNSTAWMQFLGDLQSYVSVYNLNKKNPTKFM